MSLSVEEKVRVAHVLDDLGIPFIEAGFPASNPKEAELFARLEHEGLRADVCAFGMTRRRDVAAPRTIRRCASLAESFAPVCTLVGKTWSLHLEKVVQGRPRREPGDDRRVGRVPGRRGQARDLRRRALLRRLPRRPGVRARLPARRRRGGRRERDAVRHQRRVAARTRSPRRCAPCATRWRRRGRHPLPQRRRVRGGELARRRRRGRRARPGHDERLRRALRQRQPHEHRAEPPAQARPRLPADAGGLDRGRALPRRAAQPHRPTRTSRTWARTRSRTRAACTSPASTPTPPRSSTSTRPRSATAARCWSPSCPARAP